MDEKKEGLHEVKGYKRVMASIINFEFIAVILRFIALKAI